MLIGLVVWTIGNPLQPICYFLVTHQFPRVLKSSVQLHDHPLKSNIGPWQRLPQSLCGCYPCYKNWSLVCHNHLSSYVII
jgi:hypothetical protein